MKFIHAADSHLGNPFKGLDRELPAALKQLVQASTMHAFEKMITQALTAQVDFLVIAGIYIVPPKIVPKSKFLCINNLSV